MYNQQSYFQQYNQQKHLDKLYNQNDDGKMCAAQFKKLVSI